MLTSFIISPFLNSPKFISLILTNISGRIKNSGIISLISFLFEEAIWKDFSIDIKHLSSSSTLLSSISNAIFVNGKILFKYWETYNLSLIWVS